MKKSIWILVFLLNALISNNTFGQKKEFILTGRILDSRSGEPIENASIQFSGLSLGANSDSSGYFSVILTPRIYQISIRSLGYKLKIERFNLTDNLKINILLEQTQKLLDEVVISAEKSDANVNRTMMGMEKLSGKSLKKLPNLMGEADVIRSIMLLPGVSTVGEGASGFNVRGGNVDQNLVLLDGVPLFNTSHLFGFFTGFNADIVQDLSLYKGGIPSKYGGKTSSVLDVRTKEGNFDKWEVQGGLGPIASRILINGPIWKNKTSILVGGRASISDFYLKYFKNNSINNSKANFYDLNLKLTHKINENQRISLALYNSTDEFKFKQDTLYNWDTRNVNLKHNAIIRNKLSHTFTSFLSEYKYGIKGQFPEFEFSWQPTVIQKSIKEDLSLNLGEKGYLDFGAELNFFENNTGSLKKNSENSIINDFKMPVDYSRDLGIYISHSTKIFKRIGLDYGLRYAYYQLLGPSTVYEYKSGTPRQTESIIDTLNYTNGKVIKSYGGLEPRLSFSIKIDSNFSVKFGYNRMQQFLHLISNTMAISPADIWKNSNSQIPQQIADQYSIGLFKNFGKTSSKTYETSIEIYYKNLKNITDYIDGASLYLNPTVETQLLRGKGFAYGSEFFIKKARGVNLTGWMSYTYSRTFRQVSASADQIEANFGLRYPANFDTPHNFKFVINDRLSKRISFNANFTYNTGRPITFPNGRYKLYAYNDVYNYLIDNNLIPRTGFQIDSYSFNGQVYKFLNTYQINELLDGYSTPSFTLRNEERIPYYMRLDVGFTLDPKENSKSNSSWNFSIYNLLARRNVYSIYFRSATGLRTQARTYRLSVLAAAIPSLTYNFKF